MTLILENPSVVNDLQGFPSFGTVLEIAVPKCRYAPYAYVTRRYRFKPGGNDPAVNGETDD